MQTMGVLSWRYGSQPRIVSNRDPFLSRVDRFVVIRYCGDFLPLFPFFPSCALLILCCLLAPMKCTELPRPLHECICNLPTSSLADTRDIFENPALGLNTLLLSRPLANLRPRVKSRLTHNFRAFNNSSHLRRLGYDGFQSAH